MRSLLLIALLLAPATRALAQSDAFMVLEVEQAHGRSMRAVRAALAPTEPALRACGPRPDATMPTTALVSLAIDRMGHVTTVAIEHGSDEPRDASWRACAEAAIGAATFTPARRETAILAHLVLVSPTTRVGEADHDTSLLPRTGVPMTDGLPPRRAGRVVIAGLPTAAPDADAIARAVRNERVRIVGCYERALARSSTSAGAVTLHVDVAARGRFVARVLASALDEETGTCLSAVVRAMRITPLGEVEDDAFDLTLTFSPTE